MLNTNYLKLFLSAFFWGGSAIAGKVAMQYIPISFITFARFAIAALILGIMYQRDIRSFKMSLSQHIETAITALFGISLCYYFYFRGLNQSNAFNAGVIEATIPCITLIISIFINSKKERLSKVLGFGIAYVGVVFIIFEGDIDKLLSMTYSHGDLLLLISTLCFAIYNILVEKVKKNTPNHLFMFYIFLYGSLILIPWLAYESITLDMSNSVLNREAVIAILFMALGGSTIAYLFFNQVIGVIGASSAASFINLVPVITVVLSIFYLQEQILLAQWIGSAIIFAGIVMANYEPKVRPHTNTCKS